ncbi:MAG: hypothetical protein J6B80_04775 [Clostridia bacterium]|nr:hypothetical protein [Clostridia bacterium]
MLQSGHICYKCENTILNLEEKTIAKSPIVKVFIWIRACFDNVAIKIRYNYNSNKFQCPMPLYLSKTWSCVKCGESFHDYNELSKKASFFKNVDVISLIFEATFIISSILAWFTIFHKEGLTLLLLFEALVLLIVTFFRYGFRLSIQQLENELLLFDK